MIAKVPVGPRVDAYNLHKSMGITILALMLVRIGWRIAHSPPPLPPMPRWQRAAAHASHAILYVALVAQPLIGFAGSVASGYPVRLFGLTLPKLWPRDDALKDALSTAHLVVAIVLVATITLHVAAALVMPCARDGVLRGCCRCAASRGRQCAARCARVLAYWPSRAMSAAVLPRLSWSDGSAPAASSTATTSSRP